MEPRAHIEIPENRCTCCGASRTSQFHVHHCLRDRVDTAHYAELFWDEA